MLPFTNLSDDRDQQYFADGITEDLTTDLSQIAGMLVISRNTAFTYKGKPVDTKQIGRELGVRYVLEGSVRRSGNQVRVNAQLIDAETDAHLWAERFDRDTGDLFALQNEITGRIASRAQPRRWSARRPPGRPSNPDALDYIFRGRAVASRSRRRVTTMRRRSACSSAHWRSIRSPSRHRAVGDDARGPRARSNDRHRALPTSPAPKTLVGQALAASPRNPLAHFAKGQVLRAQNRCEEAIPEYETALALNRN